MISPGLLFGRIAGLHDMTFTVQLSAKGGGVEVSFLLQYSSRELIRRSLLPLLPLRKVVPSLAPFT